MNKIEGLLEELKNRGDLADLLDRTGELDVRLEGRQLDFAKARQLAHESNVANVLGSLMKAGIRGKYDPEGRMGHFLYKGYKVAFTIGGENFYFSFPKKVLHTKYAPTQTIKAIMNFLEVISDYS